MMYTVTGATGHLGRQVVAQLSQLVETSQIRALVHTPSKATFLQKKGIAIRVGDYLDQASMVQVLQGTDVLIYIPSKTYSLVQRVTELENTLAAMKQAQVSQIIFVSFFADQENNPFVMSAYYGYAPRRLASSGLQYAVVKNALYADPLIPYLPELIERRHLIYPVGNESLSFITLADSARAIAQLALHESLRNQGQTYLLSQTNSYTMPRLGALMTQVTGHEIGYAPVTLAEFAHIYQDEGDGAELASMYQAGALGLLKTTSSDYHQITGRDPEDMVDFLQNNDTNSAGNL